MRWWITLGVALSIASCGGRRAVKELTPDPKSPVDGIESTQSEVCAGCHEVVAAEWRASTHASASCADCHVRAGEVLGRSSSVEAPHPITEVARYEAWTMCLGCHTRSGPGADVLADWLAWQQNTWRGATCVDCHLPVALRLEQQPPRPGFSHYMPGAHDLETARAGVTLRALELQPDGVVLPLANKTGHRFPAGKTTAVEVFAQAMGADERTVGQGTAWLQYDGDADTRLLPGEVRGLRFRFGPEELGRAVSYQVTVRYHLGEGEILELGSRSSDEER